MADTEVYKFLDYDGLKLFKELLEEELSTNSLVGISPTLYERPSLFTSNRTEITIPANTQININNKGYVSKTDTTLQLSDVGSASDRAGKDIYIYACVPESGTAPDFVLSMNSTVPDGYTDVTSRKIGGFHGLCLAVGTISGHALSGYDTGDALPSSRWDLKFRANGSYNEGMGYSAVGSWHGIYLASFDGTRVVSAYKGEVIHGYSSVPMHGEKFNEYLAAQGMRLPWRDEFVYYAKGSNEQTNISGSAQVTTTGGNVDTAGRRMISDEGFEDCCGSYWQWTRDVYGAFNIHASSSTPQYGGLNASGNYYIDGCNWDATVNGTSRMVESTIDGSSSPIYGDQCGGLLRAHVGARWDDGSSCGSRSVSVSNLSTYRYSHSAARCAAEPMVVN